MFKCKPTAQGGFKPLAAIVASLTAVVSGLGGLILQGNSGGGGAASAWRATADGFYVPGAARQVVALDEDWRFATGDDLHRAEATFDDSDWSAIKIDQPWEDEGFGDYDGFAWYRCRFTIGEIPTEGALYLRLGRIDDADEVWVNGERIGGHGDLAPGGRTAWDTHRNYSLRRGVLRAGAANVVAVRVWDERMAGGMVDGAPAIMVQDLPGPLLDLSGEWLLSRDDQPDYRNDTVDTTDFDPVIVPGAWDQQGRQDFDGDLWYRVRFTAPEGITSAESLVMVLGVIDDEDEVYLNGTLVGSTRRDGPEDDVWARERAYRFAASMLRDGSNANVLAVRVHDVWGDGGIVAGPVGIMREEAWTDFQAGRDQASQSWARLWNWLLGRS